MDNKSIARILRDTAQLLEIDGIGPTKVEKFGPAIIEICGAKTDNC